MSWTAPKTWTSGSILTSAELNTHVRDNLNETGAAKVTTAWDLLRGAGANSLARVALGAADTILHCNGTSWSWNANPTATSFGGPSGSNASIRSDASILLEIDRDNNSSTATLQVRINGGATEVFEVREDGQTTIFGEVLFNTDDANSIGGAAASRPRYVHASRGIGVGSAPTDGVQAVLVSRNLTAGASATSQEVRVNGTIQKTGSTGELRALEVDTNITVDASVTCDRATQVYLNSKTASIGGGGAVLSNHNALFVGTPSGGSTVRPIDSASGGYLTTGGVWTDNPSWDHLKTDKRTVGDDELDRLLAWVRDDFKPIRYRRQTQTGTERRPVYAEAMREVEAEGPDGQPVTLRVPVVEQVGEEEVEVVTAYHPADGYDHFGYRLEDVPEWVREIVCDGPTGGIVGKDTDGLLLALVSRLAQRVEMIRGRR